MPWQSLRRKLTVDHLGSLRAFLYFEEYHSKNKIQAQWGLLCATDSGEWEKHSKFMASLINIVQASQDYETPSGGGRSKP